MIIVLDTNVLISGTFWNGDSRKILELISIRKALCCISKEIIEEYNRVMIRDDIVEKIEEKNLVASKVIEKVILEATLVEPKIKIEIVKDDLSDNKILECAIAGKAKYIITKDQHLLKFKKYNNIQIITPKEFLEKHINSK